VLAARVAEADDAGMQAAIADLDARIATVDGVSSSRSRDTQSLRQTQLSAE